MNVQKLFHNKKFLLAIALAAVLFIIIIAIIVNTQNQKIDLASYTKITVSGLNTQGKATCILDKESLKNALTEKKVDTFNADAIIQTIKCNVNKSDNLKNGDKLQTTTAYDTTLAEQLNLPIKSSIKSITVSGLAVGKAIDIFKDVKISYSGTSPDGKVSIINNSSDPFVSSIDYTSSKAVVANGDKVQITANYDSDKAVQQRLLITQDTRTYNVSGLPEYLSKAKQLNSESLKSLKVISDKLIGNDLQMSIPTFVNHLPNLKTFPGYSFEDTYSFKNIQLQKAYIYTKKSNVTEWMPQFKHNAVFLISSVDILANGHMVGTTCMVTEIGDAVIDGQKVSEDDTNTNAGQYYTMDKAQEAVENWFGNSSYNLEPINMK